MSPVQSLREPTAKERLTGLFLIIIVAVIWIAASFVVQELDIHPFLLTYICNILFVVYIPVAALNFKKRKADQHPLADQQADLESASVSGHERQSLRVEASPEAPGSSGSARVTRESLWVQACNLLSDHTWTIIRAASAVAPFWFLAQLCFNTALHLTSVTSNTILSSPSSLFTFILSVIVLHERFTYSKLTGVVLTVIGAILVALADRVVDSDKAEHPSTFSHAVLGDLLTLAAAALYACYTVLIKIMMPEDSESDMMAFFGYLGAVNAVLFTPVLVLMQLAGSINIFQVSRATMSVAFVKGLFDNTLADYLWSRAVMLLGPTMATVALQLQVPMAMVTDPLRKAEGWWSSISATMLELAGAAAILSGFFWLNFST